ncbi:MAG: ABC transporter ATP-binding protein [Clostridia bacterium]|nr:ABC transporter ATP-binding protein [Clostridia bacterium]
MKDTSVLKWIYKSCGKLNKECAALIVLNALAAVCTTMFALSSKTVMDNAQSGNKDELIRNVIILFALIAIQLISRISASFIEAVSQGKAEISLKSMVFSRIIHGKYAESVEKHSGDLMSRLTSDVLLVSEQYVHILPNAVSMVLRLAVTVVALYTIDKRFFLMILVCGVLVPFIIGFSRRYIKDLHRKVREKDSKVRSFMQEMLENLFAVKVFGIEDKIISMSLKQQKSFYREKVKKKGFSILAGIAFSMAFAIGFLIAVAYGSYGVLNGTMTFGSVVAIIQLVNQLRAPAVGITGIIPSFYGMIASAQRLIEISGTESEELDYPEMSYDEFVKIKVQDATFGYRDEKVINNASFTINKGEFIGIKGPSGAGKSTLFKLITGLYPLNDGSAVVETVNGDVDCKYTKRLFSFVPQDNMLFSGTVKENITILNPDATDDEIRKALENSAAEFAYDLDGGLDFVLGESGAGVSQGQAQRLAVARALLGKGKVLLMDEATSALDSETEKTVMKKLKENKDITVVFITHREMVLEDCDRIITVANGTVSEN